MLSKTMIHFDGFWRRFRLTASVLSIALLFLLIPQVAFAVGLTPSRTVAKDLVPGMKIEKHVTVTRADVERAAQATFEITGDAAAYIRPREGLRMVLPKGQQQTPFYFNIEPGTLGSGEYEATIKVILNEIAEKDVSGGNAGSKVLAAAEGTIRFSITNKSIEKFRISSIILKHTEERKPLGFTYHMINEGNVDTRLHKVTVNVVDQTDDTNTFSTEILKDDFPIMKAFQEGEVAILTKLQLPIGLYYVDIKAFDKKNKEVFSLDKSHLQIFPEGTLAQKGELVSFTVDKELYELGELVEFTAPFKNVGEIGFEGNLMIDVFIGDRRVDVLKSETAYVPEGDATEYSMTFRIPEPGEYLAEGHVRYGIHDTESMEVTFETPAVDVTGYIIVFVGLIILLVGGYLWWRRRKKNTPPAAPAPQTPTPAAPVNPAPPAAPHQPPTPPASTGAAQ
jgi:LPXTG-motif cell wall-anchored protein